MSTILLADDERNILSGLELAFEDEGYNVLTAQDGKEAWNKLSSNDVDLVITDLRMPELSGDELIKRVSSAYPRLPVIVLTGHGNIETAVKAMQDGAVDFFTKPVDLDKLLLVVRKTVSSYQLENQNRKLTEEIEKLKKKQTTSRIMGKSSKVNTLLETIEQIAPTKASVLITGESGTGKELVADALVEMSPRKDKPFIKLHCASLSPSLLESELFGHEKGAFTGAVNQKKGRFELADGGTLFLDEISEIDQSTQVKLLRVLQEREFERVGGEKPIQVDVRLIAATNKDLYQEVKKGNFREDLYYRLAVVGINVPPLRDRKEDIELLAAHFMEEFAKEDNKNVDIITPAARKLLYSYSWPGNVRELKNAIEASVVMTKNRIIEVEDLPAHIREAGEETKVELTLPVSMEEAEKKLILETIAFCRGNKTKAAELMKIGRKTLHRKLNEYKEGDD